VTTAVVLLVAIVVFSGYWATRPGVTRLNYERIRPGMTLEDVRALMGGGGRELPPDASVITMEAGGPVERLRGARKFQWADGYTDIRIGFDNNRVTTKCISDWWTDYP
jgi:hypothetical protein